MTTPHVIRTILLAGVMFAGSFLATVTVRSQPTTQPPPTGPSPIGAWLGLDPSTQQAIEQRDPGFVEDLAALRGRLREARMELADLFEDVDATDEMIRRRVEATIEAHNRLERRVADHLIAVRHHLSPNQQKKLFQLCADGVRYYQQRQWRHRGGRGDGLPDEPARGRGSGPRRHRGGGS